MADVFISHSHHDALLAQDLCSRIEARGLPCWISTRNIEPSARWAREIMQAIGGARAAVLVHSPQASESAHVIREVEIAAHRGLTIFPVRVAAGAPGLDLEYYLHGLQWLDATERPLGVQFDRVADVVRASLGPSRTVDPSGPLAAARPRPSSGAPSGGDDSHAGSQTVTLHWIWIIDRSGSMNGSGKLAALNAAIRGTIPWMRATTAANVGLRLLVRAVAFSNGARWLVRTPTPIEDLTWQDVEADGVTDLGKALELVAADLRSLPTSGVLPPVLVLVSDGQPTDDFRAGLRALVDLPWARRASRFGIAIGEDADADVLRCFIGDPTMAPMCVGSPEALAQATKWLATIALTWLSSSIPLDQVPQDRWRDASPGGPLRSPPVLAGDSAVW